MARTERILGLLHLACWLTGTAAECGITAAQVDFAGPDVTLITLSEEGTPTDWPFPGGSVRFTNIGTTPDGQGFDLVVIEQEGSTRPYKRPGVGAAAALSGGFACLGVGVENSTCTNGGTFDRSWTPAQPNSQACDTGELQTAGDLCTPLLPPFSRAGPHHVCPCGSKRREALTLRRCAV